MPAIELRMRELGHYWPHVGEGSTMLELQIKDKNDPYQSVGSQESPVHRKS